jgi:hypothetical protein
MKSLIYGVAAGLLIQGLAFAASGGSPDDPSGINSSGSGNTQGVTDPSRSVGAVGSALGVISSLDRGSNRIRVRDTVGSVTELKLDDKTEIRNGQTAATFSDLNAGDTVRVEYDPATLVARKIEVASNAR